MSAPIPNRASRTHIGYPLNVPAKISESSVNNIVEISYASVPVQRQQQQHANDVISNHRSSRFVMQIKMSRKEPVLKGLPKSKIKETLYHAYLTEEKVIEGFHRTCQAE